MIKQISTTTVEPEPFISGWFMLYILLILFYNGLVVYSQVSKTKPETQEEFVKQFINEYLPNKTTVVWSFSTIVFFIIYGAWNLCQ